MSNKILTLMAICMGLLTSCSNWRDGTQKGLEYAQQAGVALRESGAPALDAICTKEARACIAAGVQKPEDCPGWMKCNSYRSTIARALEALQRATLDASTALAIGDSQSADEAVGRAVQLLAQVRQSLKEMKVL